MLLLTNFPLQPYASKPELQFFDNPPRNILFPSLPFSYGKNILFMIGDNIFFVLCQF